MLVPIEQIEVGARLRALREEAVSELMDSIAEIGLQSPITVTSEVRRNHGTADGVRFILVTGLHRLTACQRLGLVEIEANVADLSDVQRRLWEIDENLCRADLTELERGEHLMERKLAYEKLHPETAYGAAQAHGMHRMLGHNVGANLVPTFSRETTEKSGLSATAIQRAIRRAKNIAPDVRDRIRARPDIADNGQELDALASLGDAALQKKAVALVESGQADGIRDARKLMENGTTRVSPNFKSARDVSEKRFYALVSAWNQADAETRQRFLDALDIPVADNAPALRVIDNPR